MVLEMDNMGAVHLANNWRVGGRTQHADLKHHFSRDLKDNGIIAIWHVSGEENDLDIFTKNTIGLSLRSIFQGMWKIGKVSVGGGRVSKTLLKL